MGRWHERLGLWRIIDNQWRQQPTCDPGRGNESSTICSHITLYIYILQWRSGTARASQLTDRPTVCSEPQNIMTAFLFFLRVSPSQTVESVSITWHYHQCDHFTHAGSPLKIHYATNGGVASRPWFVCVWNPTCCSSRKGRVEDVLCYLQKYRFIDLLIYWLNYVLRRACHGLANCLGIR